jgi:hypothetical protein
MQVSEVYQTIEFGHLAKLVPFASNYRLEKIIVNAAKTLDLQVSLDSGLKIVFMLKDMLSVHVSLK